jgi:hypothetical protein
MKKTTLTIGIPAYNEELNIEGFLRSLFDQKLHTIILDEILVYSDHSTDRTNQIVQKLSKIYHQIKLIEGKSNKGKYRRVNELFHRNKSDALVILDADIALEKDDFLETFVHTLTSDKKALMIAANVKLVQPESFSAKIIHAGFVFGDLMRLSVPGYDIAPNFHGAATVYRGSFAKTISIPENVSDPHLYIYLFAKKQNGFRYCPQANVLQYPPSTIGDVKQMMQRSIGKTDPVLESLFGKEMIEQVHFVPRKAKFIAVLKSFQIQPLYTPLALMVSFYLGRIVKPGKIDETPVWKINKSTKKPFTYAK